MLKKEKKEGFTLIELMVVLVIVGLLSTIAVNSYLSRVEMAKGAAAKAMMGQFALAIAAYEVDNGQIPPSGSGSSVADLASTSYAQGNGFLLLCLTHSINSLSGETADSAWHGPYLDVPSSQIGQVDGSPQVLDPWGSPYIYIAAADYATRGGTELPASSPYYATEVYYNPSSYQIVCLGADGTTSDPPFRGTDPNDLANFMNAENGAVESSASSAVADSSSSRIKSDAPRTIKPSPNGGMYNPSKFMPVQYQAPERATIAPQATPAADDDETSRTIPTQRYRLTL